MNRRLKAAAVVVLAAGALVAFTVPKGHSDEPLVPLSAGMLQTVQACDHLTFTAGPLPVDITLTVEDGDPSTPPHYPTDHHLEPGEVLRVESIDPNSVLRWSLIAMVQDGWQAQTGGETAPCP